MSEVPRLSKSELNVLRQLIVKEKYGIELVAGSDGQLARRSIYVVLGRMEDKGYISGREVETPDGEQGPPRRFYRVTGHGHRALQANEAAAAAFAGDLHWRPT